MNQGKVYEVYARKVGHGSLFGFVEIEELGVRRTRRRGGGPVGGAHQGRVRGVKRSFLPMHSVLRIDEVTKRGASKITQYEGNVTPFPAPVYAPASDPGHKP